MSINIIIGADSLIANAIISKSKNYRNILFAYARTEIAENILLSRKQVEIHNIDYSVIEYQSGYYIPEKTEASNRLIKNVLSTIEDREAFHIYYLCGVEEPPLPRLRSTYSEVGANCVNINFSAFVDLMHQIQQILVPGDSICVLSSSHGVRTATENPIYGATKAAINHYIQCLAARELKQLRPGDNFIKYNSVCPEGVETPMIRRVFANDEKLINEYSNSRPLKRLLTPEEVAEAMIYLNQSSGITGQILTIGNSI